MDGNKAIDVLRLIVDQTKDIYYEMFCELKKKLSKIGLFK